MVLLYGMLILCKLYVTGICIFTEKHCLNNLQIGYQTMKK